MNRDYKAEAMELRASVASWFYHNSEPIPDSKMIEEHKIRAEDTPA